MTERYPDDFALVNVPFEDQATRIRNVASAKGWETVADVRYMDDVEMLRFPNLGRRSLREIRRLIPREAKRPPQTADQSLEDRVAALERTLYGIGEILRSA